MVEQRKLQTLDHPLVSWPLPNPESTTSPWFTTLKEISKSLRISGCGPAFSALRIPRIVFKGLDKIGQQLWLQRRCMCLADSDLLEPVRPGVTDTIHTSFMLSAQRWSVEKRLRYMDQLRRAKRVHKRGALDPLDTLCSKILALTYPWAPANLNLKIVFRKRLYTWILTWIYLRFSMFSLPITPPSKVPGTGAESDNPWLTDQDPASPQDLHLPRLRRC